MTAQPFGTPLGTAPGGVVAYSSDYATADSRLLPDRSAYRHYVGDIYTGYKWQCVEFARRWLLVNRGYVFQDIAMAYDIFRLQQVTVCSDSTVLPLRSFRNGSRRRPEVGCMLIWSEGGAFEHTGHVAIVMEVTDDYVCVAEQNVDHELWPEGKPYARQLAASLDAGGGYWLRCSFHDGTILGWVIQTGDDEHAEIFPPAEPALFTILSHRQPEPRQTVTSWLNPANPDEAAFMRSMGGAFLSSVAADRNRYFSISRTAQQELKRATNELHALFLHATHTVLTTPELQKHFNIPDVLWPRIRQSWDNRRNEMITGRFDFCLTEAGLKLYEYNADSASCHMECGKVQGKWAEYYRCETGVDAGEDLYDQLVTAWRKTGITGTVHILVDDVDEERYHALYMQDAMTAAGIRSKCLTGFEGLAFNAHREVEDADGELIEWVWKTWAWETALEELRQQLLSNPDQPPASPRLLDVLTRPDTMVFEPLWTVVPSNKAILPVLWDMFPDHPYLLESRFRLNEGLRQQGYVSKPIAGRCGQNIRLHDADSGLIDETGGAFEQQNLIYQAICPLPRIAGYNVQLCTFSVAGNYAGSCVRVDQSPIITTHSDVLPLRVVNDSDLLREIEHG